MDVYHFSFKAMGSPCELRLYAPSKSRARKAARHAIAEVRRLESKYSRYRADSVTTQINEAAGNADSLEVDEETAALLDYAAVAYQQSGGLFDISSGILRKAWNFKSKRVPTQQQIDQLLARIGWEKIVWERPHLILPLKGMELDFGGYVKEYAADTTATVCSEQDIEHGMVDLGGDLRLIGPHPDGSPWRIGIRHPRQPEEPMATIELKHGAVASSGDYERFMIVDGRRYGHILSPKSGWPVDGLASVSVVAEQCLIAGTASTIAMLKGDSDGPAWLDALGLPNIRMDQSSVVSGTLANTANAA